MQVMQSVSIWLKRVHGKRSTKRVSNIRSEDRFRAECDFILSNASGALAAGLDNLHKGVPEDAFFLRGLKPGAQLLSGSSPLLRDRSGTDDPKKASIRLVYLCVLRLFFGSG